MKRIAILLIALLPVLAAAQTRFSNPILHTDYSDPDVCQPGTLSVTTTNTGSSEDLTRMVTVKVGDAAEQSVAGGVATTATPKVCEFEIEAGEVKIYPTGNALCFYKIEFHSN